MRRENYRDKNQRWKRKNTWAKDKGGGEENSKCVIPTTLGEGEKTLEKDGDWGHCFAKREGHKREKTHGGGQQANTKPQYVFDIN